jgi:signal transduction histidine kinase
MLLVKDTLLDERFRSSPLVTGAPYLRSYFASPLVDADTGQAIGALCVADVEPRDLSSLQRIALCRLGQLSMALFERQRRENTLEALQNQLKGAYAMAEDARLQATQATQAKTQFLNAMSHEIRTPMNAVLGICRLLAGTDLSLEQQQYVGMITNSGQLLLTIINDILDFGKLEAGQLIMDLQPHNTTDVVESALLLVFDTARQKGLALTWDIDSQLPATLLLDANRLQQVLLNLLSNGPSC